MSQAIALVFATLTMGVLVSYSEIALTDPFSVEIYVGFAAAVLILFGVVFYALRLVTRGSPTYWRMERDNQIRPIGWMIFTILTVMFGLLRLLDALTPLDPVYCAVASYLLTMTFLPAAFFQCGLVAWPVRVGTPSTLNMTLIAASALGFALAVSFWTYTATPEPLGFFPVGPALVRLGAIIIGATAEEVVFRVLLFTAILGQGGSRFEALFLSSTAFALMHVPGQFAEPVVTADWDLLRAVAYDYGPLFLAQMVMGLILGAIWLRTGSITLIALTHTLLNTGNMMSQGL